MKFTILIVDDEDNLRRAVKYGLSGGQFRVLEAKNGLKALEVLAGNEVDLVVSDLKMPQMDGMTFLNECRRKYFQMPVIILTAFGSTETAVEAMKTGAVDFLIKPFPLEELVEKVRGLLAAKRGDDKPVDGFIGFAEPMEKVRFLCRKFAPSASPVLVTGESGTGKEVTARYIHELSGRSGRFLAVNCGALPENLLESQLFGFRKGAFTGADRDSKGLFMEAGDGTLMLDEIGETTPRMQVALLRVIQEREFIPLGTAETVKASARIIACTNRDIGRMAGEGRFREDLYYRLKVLAVHLPPLRERREDIPILARHFLERFADESGRKIDGFDDAAQQALAGYHFPGNVRELSNMIERSVWLSEGRTISAGDLELDGHARPEPDSARVEFKDRVEEYERGLIMEAIGKFGRNRTVLSEKLGINRTALLYKLKKYHLKDDG
ncbi:MAG: sigma-54 dependent transcriptional regulator [Candidatus Wallbacteria bacterium]|nr:sigma-54 dependent transcriptional regulator [Candidatus Wallbacteria bacterium]